jgi:hypothetical protein
MGYFAPKEVWGGHETFHLADLPIIQSNFQLCGLAPVTLRI